MGIESVQNLDNEITNYLDLCDNPDIDVRRYTIESLVTVCHSQPALLWKHHEKLSSLIKLNNKFKKEYIVEIDLGPFKHKTDEGKGLRQASYQLLLVALSEFAEKIESALVIEVVLEGLSDPDIDCQQSGFQIMSRLISIAPGIILGQLNNVIDSAKKIIEAQKKLSKTNVTNLLRVAIKTIIELKSLPEIDTNSLYQEFFNGLQKDAEISQLLISETI